MVKIPQRYRSIIIINVSLVVILLGVFAYLLLRPINVLDGWKITTDKTAYYPLETIKFTSQAHKLVSADGTAIRYLYCPADARNEADRIELFSVPAKSKPGELPTTTNQVDIPKAEKFGTLPRMCQLRIDVCYSDVILWRDSCESNQTRLFTVVRPNPELPKPEMTPQEQVVPNYTSDGITDITDTKALPEPTAATTTTTNNTTNNTTTESSKCDLSILFIKVGCK